MKAEGDKLRLVLYSRPGCVLCDEMAEALAEWLVGRPYSAEVRDIDDDPAAQARYGLLIPVLVLDGRELCRGRLDPDLLDGLLTR
jgi:hypothetical protein